MMPLFFLLACVYEGFPYEHCSSGKDCVDVPDEAVVTCLDKAEGGFCTWACVTDSDCVHPGYGLVCTSFESSEGNHCLPSCEEGEELCPDGMSCRSSGGGSDNRKICFPD